MRQLQLSCLFRCGIILGSSERIYVDFSPSIDTFILLPLIFIAKYFAEQLITSYGLHMLAPVAYTLYSRENVCT